MGLRQLRRQIKVVRLYAEKRFRRHRRINQMAQPGVHQFIIVLDHLKPAYNIGKIFRSADAFGAHEIHLVGIDFFDPAPAMGSFKWVPTTFHKSFAECQSHLVHRGYDIFILNPSAEQSLTQTHFPAQSAFVFGHEEFGFSFALQDYPDLRTLAIPQFGKVQSLNVSIAASVVMYEYIRQNTNK